MLAEYECTIRHVSELFGLTPRAIRLYEDEGLVTPRRDRGGRRKYGSAARARLEQIARFRRAGLALADIRVLLGGSSAEKRKAQLVLTLGRRVLALEAELRETRNLLDAAQSGSAPVARATAE